MTNPLYCDCKPGTPAILRRLGDEDCLVCDSCNRPHQSGQDQRIADLERLLKATEKALAGADAERTELTQQIADLRAALAGLVNLHHGQSKRNDRPHALAGISGAEWCDALAAAEKALTPPDPAQEPGQEETEEEGEELPDDASEHERECQRAYEEGRRVGHEEAANDER